LLDSREALSEARWRIIDRVRAVEDGMSGEIMNELVTSCHLLAASISSPVTADDTLGKPQFYFIYKIYPIICGVLQYFDAAYDINGNLTGLERYWRLFMETVQTTTP
jgi:hypothetical protein